MPQGTKYTVHGSDLQYVEVMLQPRQALMAEQKSMMFVERGVRIETVLGDGAASRIGLLGRFWRALKRSWTGESLFSNRYVNTGSSVRRVAIAAPGPGAIVPIDLAHEGGQVVCQRGAYLCGDQGTTVSLAFQKRLRTGFLGGEGFIMQKLAGQGLAFVHACGALRTVELGPEDQLRIDTGCLVAVASTVRYDVSYTGSLKTSIFGGEGMFYATVQGPGKVWLQSLPAQRLSQYLISGATTGRRGGSVWGKLYLWLIVLIAIGSIFGGQ